MKFALSPVIRELILARNNVRNHYANSGLSFTLDGNLIGDLGEALAADIFGIQLVARNGTGIDGHAPDCRSVQVKASGTKRGPAFRMVDTRAQHLLFFHLNMDACSADLLFNGPEEIALETLRVSWTGQRTVSVPQIRAADARVSDELRLRPLSNLNGIYGTESKYD
jgi:hypothetical protein